MYILSPLRMEIEIALSILNEYAKVSIVRKVRLIVKKMS